MNQFLRSLICAKQAKDIVLDLENYCGKMIKTVNDSLVKVVGKMQIEITSKNSGVKSTTQLKRVVINDIDFSLLLLNDFNPLPNISIHCKNKKLTRNVATG